MAMLRVLAMMAVLAMPGSGAAQGMAPGMAPGLLGPGRNVPSIQGLTTQQETPEQKRAFCQRVATAASRCGMAGGFSMAAMTTCLVQGLPAQDSMRVAQVAQSSRGGAAALLSECGIGLGR
jgi:hypothetical protein